MTGAELRAARERLRMSQAQLAEALGLAPASGPRSVRAMEVGMREVSGPVSKVVAFLLNGCCVPDGWQMVPIEATVAMVKAGNMAAREYDRHSLYQYEAMLSAAPPVGKISR